jgi:NAD-dependent SIR2 family protein deacetylase
MFYEEAHGEKQNPLLERPELALSEEEKKLMGETSFSFSSASRRYCLGHKDGEPFLMIEYYDSLPDELTETDKEKFSKETRKKVNAERVVYVLKHGPVPEEDAEIEEPNPSQSKNYRVARSRDFELGMLEKFVADDANKQVLSEILTKHSKLSPEETSQIVGKVFEASRKHGSEAVSVFSRRFSDKVARKIQGDIRAQMLPKPHEIQENELLEILRNNRVLFYTGAGVSIANGVPGMEQLQVSMQIEMAEKVDGLLKRVVENPQSVIDSWEEFMKAALEKPATPAHKSLAFLAQKLKTQIFTENVDHLQEKAGVKATHLTGPWLKENVQPKWLKDIDVVIVVGLNYDDRGFLGWYKENNPNGKIIAIDLSQPSYLGNEDFLLKGDCQKVFPELEKEFVAKEQNL